MEIVIRKPTPLETAEAAAWPVWSCEPSRFEWGYAEDETSLILEGRAKVEAMGKVWEFGADDWVVFPKGLACRWTVLEAVRKHYKLG